MPPAGVSFDVSHLLGTSFSGSVTSVNSVAILFQVMFSCQPVGHTHGEVDAAFGIATRALKNADALVLNGNPSVFILLCVVCNKSQLFSCCFFNQTI